MKESRTDKEDLLSLWRGLKASVGALFSSIAGTVTEAFKEIGKLFQSREAKFLARVAEQERVNSTKIPFKTVNHKKHILRVKVK